MKKILLIPFLLSIYCTIYAQDTIDILNFNDGSKSFKLIAKKDTTLINIYPCGRRESVRKIRNNQITGLYCRYYENGNIMWKKEFKNGIQNGKAEFFNEKGVKVAEFICKNNIITDTVFIKKGIHLILGKITYSSIIYGGVENEDGSSNISKSAGPYINISMNAIQIDSIKKTLIIKKFRSDYNGDFSVIVNEGKTGFYPDNIKKEILKTEDFAFIGKLAENQQEGWSMKEPLIINKDSRIIFTELHHYSVAYAP